MSEMVTPQTDLRRNRVAAWLLAATLGTSAAAVCAHEGEDHGQDGPAPPVAALAADAPRASAQTDVFEVVAVLQAPPQSEVNKAGGQATTLTLYIDDFATNAPTEQAKVEVESGSYKASATMQSPGVYTAAAAALAPPGQYPLTISVETDDAADLLSLTLDTRPAPQGPSHGSEEELAHAWLPGWAWGLGMAAALLFGGVGITRLTRARQRHASTLPTNTKTDAAL